MQLFTAITGLDDVYFHYIQLGSLVKWFSTEGFGPLQTVTRLADLLSWGKKKKHKLDSSFKTTFV